MAIDVRNRAARASGTASDQSNGLPARRAVQRADGHVRAYDGTFEGGANSIAVSLYRFDLLCGGRVCNARKHSQSNRPSVQAGIDGVSIDVDGYRIAACSI
ncbi:hypothetical protein NS258_06260 [Sphingomonas sanguinis]|uniref:Uncharacterized protein n=1 Tax=Sphingomonas sanguinis TaxID=33051 RepID=A0A147JA13_9SPHN|nr:hypothetical protein NS258_06260 [Sphingomonas sanguinis]